jgi:hypothetical protein
LGFSEQPNGDNGQRRWHPSAGFKAGLLAVAVFATVLAVVTALAAKGESELEAADDTPAPTVAVSHAPRPTTPPDDFTRALDGSQPGAVVGGVSITPTASSTATPRASSVASTAGSTAGAISTAAAPVGTLSPTRTPTAGEASSATPIVATTAPGNGLTSAAEGLAREIEGRFGIVVGRTGQDWGKTEAAQLRNLEAVASALSALPPEVLAEVSANPGGPLTLLSNGQGMTLGGWQPYGNRAANYYTNEDRGEGGFGPANQIVLQPGSPPRTVAHEVLHGYQMRDAKPGDYVPALITPEMKSFMTATGWRQTATDAELLAASDQNWNVINGFFVYEGPELAYANEYGQVAHLYAPNPLEAFAEAGAFYYARSPGMALPEWPAVWAWYEANLG